MHLAQDGHRGIYVRRALAITLRVYTRCIRLQPRSHTLARFFYDMVTRNAYWRTVRTTAKGRWFGRTRKDVLSELSTGARLIDDSETDLIIKEHDVIEYDVHMHEPNVPTQCPEIIYKSPDFIAVNKPSGIPTHPTVNYYANTVTEYLKSIGLEDLYPCYRLDKLTSGVLILARNPESLQRFLAGKRSKVYYARVHPCPVWEINQVVPLRERIVTFNAKRGYDAFVENFKRAKESETFVSLVGKDPENGYGIVKCIPVTGRTHQIRKSLALAGHPIHNDPIYNDGGMFRQLCSDPSESNFKKVYQFYEDRRVSKLTGGKCSECGSLEYSDVTESLDLHCARYVNQMTSKPVGENDGHELTSLDVKAPVAWLSPNLLSCTS